MTTALLLLAQLGDDEAVNQWLDENPLVLGSICLALGGGLAAYGAYELRTGVARDKRGRVLEGGTGKAMAILRLVFGAIVVLFGVYKMVAG